MVGFETKSINLDNAQKIVDIVMDNLDIKSRGQWHITPMSNLTIDTKHTTNDLEKILTFLTTEKEDLLKEIIIILKKRYYFEEWLELLQLFTEDVNNAFAVNKKDPNWFYQYGQKYYVTKNFTTEYLRIGKKGVLLHRLKQSLIQEQENIEALAEKLTILSKKITTHESKTQPLSQVPAKKGSWLRLPIWLGGKSQKEHEALSFDNFMATKEIEDAFTIITESIPKPSGILILGPSQSGKTTFAKIIAQAISKQSPEIVTNIKGTKISKSGLIQAWQKATGNHLCILVENIDLFALKDEKDKAKQESLKHLLELLDQKDPNKTIIMTSTKTVGEIDELLAARVQNIVVLKRPNLKQRTDILKAIMDNKKIKYTDADLGQLTIQTAGFTQDNLQAAIHDTLVLQKKNPEMVTYDLIKARIDALRQANQLSAIKAIDPVKFADLALDPAIVHKIQTTIQQFKTTPAGEFSTSKGMLFYGPPGTGKTKIAQATANESGCNFRVIEVQALATEYVGSGPKNLLLAFDEAAELAPCILFMDEIDSFGDRKHKDLPSHKVELINLLLQLTDGASRRPGVYVIGATNYIDNLDSAIRDRFDVKIEILLPSFELRKKALTNAFNKNKWPITYIEELAKKTENRTFREIDSIITAIQSACEQKKPCSDQTIKTAILEKLKEFQPHHAAK